MKKRTDENVSVEGLIVWMKSVRMTRDELAKSIGYSSNLLWRILSGSRDITDAFRWRFGAVYGFDLVERVLGLNMPEVTPVKDMAEEVGVIEAIEEGELA
jgi:transcriptional regulator with XRE-family HTH domain